MATRKRKGTKTPMGRHSAFRSKKLKVPIALSVTPECVEQVRQLVEAGDQANRSVWFEDIVWKLSRRRRPL